MIMALVWQTRAMLPYELMVGLRYTRAGRKGFISFISGLATAGIALGVAALIIVLSVMNGFQKEVRDRMLGVLSHIEVIAPGQGLDALLPLVPTIRENQQVIATAPFVTGQAMISNAGQMRGILARGIDPGQEPLVSGALATLMAGSLQSLEPGSFRIVLGRELAIALGARVGDPLVLIGADATVGPAGVTPRLRQFIVSGIFSSGHFEYDSNLVLMHTDDAERFFREQAVSGIRLKLVDMQRAPAVAQELTIALPRFLMVRDWSYENRNWFAAVQVEKRLMFIILMLIIAVAAFNLVSMLVMTVTDKRSDIAILRTVGAQRRSILAIFMIQGAWLGFLGVGLGVLGGVLIAANIDNVMGALEALFGFQVLPKGIYFIDQLPSDLRTGDVIQIGLSALCLSFLATLYPSWRASTLDPAQALRYE
jgi:lipoprotein-releasing system permease protein